MSVATMRAPRALEYVPAFGMSQDSEVIAAQRDKTEQHYWLPVSRRLQTDVEKFQALVEAWRQEVQFLSSVTEMSLHPAYQRIIGMGASVLPLLLRELENRPDHWFWALTAITGVDPVQPEDRGRIEKMSESWLKWGKEQELSW